MRQNEGGTDKSEANSHSVRPHQPADTRHGLAEGWPAGTRFAPLELAERVCADAAITTSRVAQHMPHPAALSSSGKNESWRRLPTWAKPGLLYGDRPTVIG